MSKARKRIDAGQLRFDFNRQIDAYQELKAELLDQEGPARSSFKYEEACIEVAATLKRMQRRSGMSREQLVDAVNEFLGSNKLSIHMLNHYLSKPVEYPIPAFYLFAFQRVAESLDVCGMYAEAEGARVISGDEVRQMTLGKIDENILELQRLKRELRSGR